MGPFFSSSLTKIMQVLPSTHNIRPSQPHLIILTDLLSSSLFDILHYYATCCIWDTAICQSIIFTNTIKLYCPFGKDMNVGIHIENALKQLPLKLMVLIIRLLLIDVFRIGRSWPLDWINAESTPIITQPKQVQASNFTLDFTTRIWTYTRQYPQKKFLQWKMKGFISINRPNNWIYVHTIKKKFAQKFCLYTSPQTPTHLNTFSVFKWMSLTNA